MSVATGKEKYARKTAPGGIGAAKYNAAKGSMPSEWAAGLAAAGVTPGPLSTQAYQQGISAAQYRGGDPDKWERNFRRGLSQ